LKKGGQKWGGKEGRKKGDTEQLGTERFPCTEEEKKERGISPSRKEKEMSVGAA